MLKKITAVFTAVMLLTVLCGCNSSVIQRTTLKYGNIAEHHSGSGTVAKNEKYRFLWDDNFSTAMLVDSETEDIWSAIPYDYYSNGDFEGVAGVRLDSALEVEYYDPNDNQVKTAYSAVEAKQNGHIYTEVKKGALVATYDFSLLEISIPVEYSLTDSGLKVSIMADKIKESGNRIYRIGLLPFMCSAKATADKGSYLVVPSGSGAIMYVDEGMRKARSVSSKVYGTDYCETFFEEKSSEEQVRLPFFGIKSGDKALCAVITDGSESALVYAQAGNTEIGYGSVYAAFTLRGTDTTYVPGSSGYKEAVWKYTSEMTSQKRFSVVYSPLSKNSGYSEMAVFYRDNYIKSKSKHRENELFLQFYGASNINASFLGVPYKKLYAVTDIETVNDTVNELSGYSDGTAVQLIGYGENGLDVGKIAGNFRIEKSLGGKKEFLNLQKSFKKDGVGLYLDLDVISFISSGSGINKYSGCAHTANGLNVTRKFYGFSLPTVASGSYTYHLVRRDKLDSIFETMSEKCDSINGLSLRSYGNTVYSDYRDQQTYCCGAFVAQANKLLKQTAKKHNLAFSEPNAFAIGYATDIFGIPTKSAGYDGLDADVPLYGIVCKGKTSFGVSAINLSDNPKDMLLKAVECGAGITYSVSGKWDNDFVLSFHSALNMSQISSVKQQIIKNTEKYRPFFNAVKNSKITEHSILADGVVQTVFDNGVSVRVNFNEFECMGIAANDYKWSKGVETE